MLCDRVIGYLRPDQFLDHLLTVMKRAQSPCMLFYSIHLFLEVVCFMMDVKDQIKDKIVHDGDIYRGFQ